MFRGIIGLLDGDPDGRIGRHRGAVDVEAELVTSFDNGRLVTGEAAGTVTTEPEVPVVGEEYITTEREVRREDVYTTFLADLETGWVSVDSGDGEFLWRWLENELNVRIARPIIDVNAIAAEVEALDRADAWQVQAGDEDAITIAYHDDARLDATGEFGQLGFGAYWDGTYLRGTLAQSGYLALFDGGEDETAAWFIAEKILPHAELPDEQQTLDDAAENGGDA